MSEKVRIPFTFIVRKVIWQPPGEPLPEIPQSTGIVGIDGQQLPVELELHPGQPGYDALLAQGEREYYAEKAEAARKARRSAWEAEKAKWEPMPISPTTPPHLAKLYSNMRRLKQPSASSGSEAQSDAPDDPWGAWKKAVTAATAAAKARKAIAKDASTHPPHEAPARIILADEQVEEGEEEGEPVRPGGGAWTSEEEYNYEVYGNVARALQQLDPGNPALVPSLDPNWVPSSEDVSRVVEALREARAAKEEGAKGKGAAEQLPDWLPPAATAKVPPEWGVGEPSSKNNRDSRKEGWRWSDPNNKGNRVRVDQGNPSHEYKSQQGDHVVVNSGGKIIGRDGQPLPKPGRIRDHPDAAHVPLNEWLKWKSWDKP